MCSSARETLLEERETGIGVDRSDLIFFILILKFIRFITMQSSLNMFIEYQSRNKANL